MDNAINVMWTVIKPLMVVNAVPAMMVFICLIINAYNVIQIVQHVMVLLPIVQVVIMGYI